MPIDSPPPSGGGDSPSSPEPLAPTPGPGPRLRRHRSPPLLMDVGALLVVLALLFALLGIPALVRFPLSTDQTIHYTGSFSLYVNQSTLEPLATPMVVPLTVSRLVKVRSGSFASAVVTEQETIRPGPLTYRQDFQYLMNRRTMAFENGSQTMMFGQPAKTDIAGSYRVNFPLGTSASGHYPVWSPETDSVAVLTGGHGPEALPGVSGVQVVEFASQVAGPATVYYRKWLLDNGFPGSISPTQLLPRLEALGVSVPDLQATFLPVLTPAQRSLVEQALASPVPIDYSYLYKGTVAIEPRTGILVRVDTTEEAVTAAPSLAGMEQLAPLVRQHIAIPAVAKLASALSQLASAPPQTVEGDTWAQTRASSQQMANLAHSQIRTMDLLDAAPVVVGGVGVVLVALGLVLRRRRPGGAGQPAVPDAPR